MKNIIKRNNQIINQKKKYLFLLLILIIGIISGIIFIFFIKNSDKSLIEEHYNLIFDSIKNNKLNNFKTLTNSISSNILSVLILYILAISIIGIPLVIIYLFIKGFSFGLSISSIFSIYKVKGFTLSLTYLFPHQLILLIIYVLLSMYAINFSLKLFKLLVLKENIPINKYFLNLNKIYLYSLIIVVICSLLESYLSPILIDLCL